MNTKIYIYVQKKCKYLILQNLQIEKFITTKLKHLVLLKKVKNMVFCSSILTHLINYPVIHKMHFTN